LLLNVSSNDEHHSITIPAIERLASGRHQDFAVVVFSPGNKATRPTKLAAGLLGIALKTWSNLPVSCAKLVFGQRFSTTRLGLSGPNGPTNLGKEAASMLHNLETMIKTPTAPKLFLNAHCAVCEYRERCRKDAVERDDLSLLTGLQPKEIEAWNERGIFTVTQLAHTFRPKTVGRSSHNPTRHSQPLQAMAIREKTIYVRKRPEMPTASTRVFLDVEGIPDTGVFYLIGLVVEKDGAQVRHQFWADSESDQQAIWHNLLAVLTKFDDYVVIHFGRYEKDFVQEMIHRYGGDDGISEAGLLARMFDVHAAVRTNVFFPVYRNGLKDIGSFLGFRWQGPIRSGLDSIVRRCKWEETRDAAVKEELLRYNHEDCMAVMAVCDHLAAPSQPTDGTAVHFTEMDALPRRRGEAFGKSVFALPGLEAITKRAYFNYQQHKVFFRTDKSVRRSVIRKRRESQAHPKVNTVIHCRQREKCPNCGGSILSKCSKSLTTKIIKDMKFFRGGVKRWVVKYATGQYQCHSCHRKCYSHEYPTHRVFGPSVGSWAIYQHVALSQSFDAIARSMSDLFGYYSGDGMPQLAFRREARFHEATEHLLLSKLRSGNMICGDETKIAVRGKRGYIWVFSGPEVVIYRFSESRDGTVLNQVVSDFEGVLVSDFYNVYDSVKCPQQKCLVHLTRDINDDLLKSPFDEELKELASHFTALMTPIIQTIDRYGLTKLHLRKFTKDSDRFCKWVTDQRFTSKVAEGYQKRIGKYGDRLFTFLSYDGVPWHNNCAENAVKLITSRRRFLDGLMSEAGMRDYLIFLSIYQTLRRKGGSFLRFLLSGKTDVFDFLGE
jgi:predicted RecB family nuclease